MKENKNFFSIFKEYFKSVFYKNKQLPESTSKVLSSNNNEKNNEFKESLEFNVDQEEVKKYIQFNTADEIENIRGFSFPADLQNCRFNTTVINDEKSIKGDYVCSLIHFNEKEKINVLPICRNSNKETASNIETFLKRLIRFQDKDKIKQIINNEIEIKGENIGFDITEDYHLKLFLDNIRNLESKSNKITIPIDYFLIQDKQGLSIAKSERLKKEEKNTMETKKGNGYIDYKEIINSYIINNTPIDLNSYNEEQILALKEYYNGLIKQLEGQQNINAFKEFAIEYIKSNPTEISSKVYNTYLDNKSQLNKNISKDKKDELLKSIQTLEFIIVKKFLYDALKNKYKIFEVVEKER